MFSSAEWWCGEEGAKAAGDVVESAQANRRLFAPFGPNVIGEATSIFYLSIGAVVRGSATVVD